MNDTPLHINKCMSNFDFSFRVDQLAQQLAPEDFSIKPEIYSTILNRTQYNYLPIAKNAHTWTTALLATNLQFTKVVNYSKILPYGKFIVILRDPIKRWIAGVAQCLSEYDTNMCRDLVHNDNFIKFLCDMGSIDGHTRPQINGLLQVDIKQCIFFKCDSTLEPTMYHFIKAISNRDSVVPCDNYNRLEDSNESKKIVYQALTERLQDKEYFDRVNKYVSTDIKFLEYITENNLWYTA